MTREQQVPLGTGFTAHSTADDVLAGLDLTGTNVVVTAGHAGLGRETTRTLTAAGARVVVGSRRPARAEAALAEAGLAEVEAWPLDLMDPASVQAFADRWLASRDPLHALVNCAGLPSPGQVERDSRGYEAQFSTDHLGHFQLTLALRPALAAAGAAGGARVVTVSSGAQRVADVNWDDVHFERDYDPSRAYAQAKTANVLFTVELDRRWAADGIRAFAVHPGIVVGTALNDAGGSEMHRAQGLVDEDGNAVIDPDNGKKTVPQGAATIVFGAASPALDGLGGVYLLNSDVSPMEPGPFDPDHITSEVAPHSIDPDSARRLWDLSEGLLRV